MYAKISSTYSATINGSSASSLSRSSQPSSFARCVGAAGAASCVMRTRLASRAWSVARSLFSLSLPDTSSIAIASGSRGRATRRCVATAARAAGRCAAVRCAAGGGRTRRAGFFSSAFSSLARRVRAAFVRSPKAARFRVPSTPEAPKADDVAAGPLSAATGALPLAGAGAALVPRKA